MGRAIVRDPQVFLFDEPLSNLDAKLRVHMRTEIKELHQRLGTTTIYVTHDQVEAMTLADLIVVLREGHIEQIGTPLELYDRPANVFVAGFIGSPAMNFFAGRVDAGAILLDSGERLAPGELQLPGDGAPRGLRNPARGSCRDGHGRWGAGVRCQRGRADRRRDDRVRPGGGHTRDRHLPRAPRA